MSGQSGWLVGFSRNHPEYWNAVAVINDQWALTTTWFAGAIGRDPAYQDVEDVVVGALYLSSPQFVSAFGGTVRNPHGFREPVSFAMSQGWIRRDVPPIAHPRWHYGLVEPPGAITVGNEPQYYCAGLITIDEYSRQEVQPLGQRCGRPGGGSAPPAPGTAPGNPQKPGLPLGAPSATGKFGKWIQDNPAYAAGGALVLLLLLRGR